MAPPSGHYNSNIDEEVKSYKPDATQRTKTDTRRSGGLKVTSDKDEEERGRVKPLNLKNLQALEEREKKKEAAKVRSERNLDEMEDEEKKYLVKREF